jgi:hypothetical protein
MNASKLNSLVLILLVTLAWAGSAVAQDPPRPVPFPKTVALDWRDFKAEEGGFSVKFPGAPQFATPEVKVGPLTITRHTYSVLAGEHFFELDYADMPAGSDPDGALNGGVSNMINSAIGRGSTLLSNEPVTRGNCTGREVMLSILNPGTSKRGLVDSLVFMSGLRMYTLVYSSETDSKPNRDIARVFLDSFTVTGGCTTMIAPTDAPRPNKSEETVEGNPDPGTGWRIIESNDLGFRVLMPGTVRHVTQKQASVQLQLDHHTFIYSKEGAVYSAEVVGDYPAGWHTTPASYQTSIDITLYSTQKNMAAVGFEITPVRDLKLGTYPGREFSLINASRGSHGRLQIYVTAKRVYVFMAFTRSDNSLTQISQYFSSIRISPK